MVKHVGSFVFGGVAAASVLVGTSASAAVLAVDFNEATDAATSPTQTDFSSANVGQNTSTPLVFTIGDYTVSTVNATGWAYPSNYTQSGARSRTALGGDSADVSDFFRDFIYANDGHGRRFALDIDGLAADTTYNVTFWAFDNAASWQGSYGNQHTVTVTQNGAPAVTGQIQYTAGTVLPESLSDNLVTLSATTDAAGSLVFEVSGTDIAILNGFSVDVVPEPASMALFAAGAGMIFRRRRSA